MGTYLGSVVGVIVFRQDVVVSRVGGYPPPCDDTRGVITEFSRKSRQRLAFVAANTSVVFKTMITLTYPLDFPCDGAQVKQHFRAFCQFLRRDTAGCSYLWFLEFQARGAPHIHILIDYPLPKLREDVKAFRFRVASTWYRVVASGDEKHLAAGTRVERIRKPDGAKRYAVKYAMKMKQKAVPPDYRNVGRFWGYSRDVVPVAQAQIQCTEDDIRGVLEGWPYAPSEDRALYSCLYGVADRFRDHLDHGAV